MKSSIPLAKNLFERLWRFVPRMGAIRKREPLEDYMTEALAYFLIASSAFRTQFVSKALVLVGLADETFEIATQSIDPEFDGRADLAMVPSSKENQRIGIEVKRFASLQPKQLERMREGFDHAFLLGPETYLWKKRVEIEKSGIRAISWEVVFEVVAGASGCEQEPTASLLAQFAEFLRSKGHAPVVIKSNPMKANSISSAARVIDEWTDLLLKIRSELGLERRGQWSIPRWDTFTSQKGASFYGVYGKGDSYAGFMIPADDKVLCYYEENRPDKNPSKKLPEDVERGGDKKLYFIAQAPYPRPNERDQAAALLTTFRKLQEIVRARAADWNKRK